MQENPAFRKFMQGHCEITEEDRRKLFRDEEIDEEAWQDIMERMEC